MNAKQMGRPMKSEAYTQDKMDKIACAALKVISKYGVLGMSIKRVARTAGIADGTVYLYFSDIDTLTKAALILGGYSDHSMELVFGQPIDTP